MNDHEDDKDFIQAAEVTSWLQEEKKKMKSLTTSKFSSIVDRF